MRKILCAAALLALGSAPANAAPAPRLPYTSFEQLPQPLPLPYAEGASGAAAVDQALARARRSGKLVLIDLGGNWCLDCRLLAATMAQQPLKGWLGRHYEIVPVDIGRYDRNLDVPARFGIIGRLAGVPAVLIVDPRTGKLRNAGRITALADARSMTPQGLADWLASWVR